MSSLTAWSIVGLMLLMCPQCTHADCNDIKSLYPNLKENGPVDEVLLNVTEPNKITLFMVTTPPNMVILESFTGKSTTRWIIRVNGTLDAEKVLYVNGHIYCNDTGSQARLWSNDINIAVTDVNEFPPEFTQSVYTVSVNEMTSPNTPIFSTINIASDRDVLKNRILYSVSSNQTTQLFGINTQGTAVITLRHLDYDFSPKQYNLTITARESAVNPLSSTAILTVNILDSDDLNPKFSQTVYNTTVNEGDYKKDILVIHPPISAVDEDSGVSSPLQYSITQTVPKTGLFSILSNGSIMVDGDLKPEIVFTISVRVSQIDRPQERYDDAIVFITVVDINDHAPRMSEVLYTANISENSPPGTVVIRVKASDGDYGLNAAFAFYFPMVQGPFEVETEGNTGIVKVADGAIVDREKQEQYNLQIYAQEVSTPESLRSHNSTLMITVLDVNDNSPDFSSDTYTYTINKNTTVGTKVGMVKATDPDKGKNREILYFIQDKTSPVFKLNRHTGEITVGRTLRDDDIGQVYLTIKAEDQAPDSANRRMSVANVIITIRDIDLHAPKFQSTNYSLSVPEDLPVNSLLMEFTASDKDHLDRLTYNLIAGNADDTFRIDSKSGALTLKTGLDREVRNFYKIIVEVSDGQKSSTTNLFVTVVDINDNSPVFRHTSYTFSVKENTRNMSKVGTVQAIDYDAGRNMHITYAIMTEMSQTVSFKINPKSGEITTFRNLDYEMETRHMLLVSAVDGGQPARTATVTVNVDVEDVNDNSPQFVSDTERISVMEGRSGVIYTAKAHDADSGKNKVIVYTKTGGSSLFRVLKNGSIESSKPLPVSNNSIIVTAYNIQPYDVSCHGCVNATLNINIHVKDVNNQPPRFNQTIYKTSINEGQVKNPVIRVFATDADTDSAYNSIVYSVVGGVNTKLIYVSPTTGEVYILNDIDYDPPSRVRILNFTVEAADTADSNIKDTTIVTIIVRDVNDNSPKFDNAVYKCKLKEDTPPGSKFGCRVHVTDIDSGKNAMVHYTIQQSPNSAYDTGPMSKTASFKVNPNSGEITTSGNLDYEMETRHVLLVSAVDGGHPARKATVTLSVEVEDVNDNSPRFLSDTERISVLEGSSGVVFTAKAHDADSGNSQTIDYTKNGGSSLFRVFRNGSIATTKSLSVGNYSVIVMAYNTQPYAASCSSCGNATLNITIVVKDINNQPPRFNQSVYTTTIEEGPVNNPVIRVFATDADTDSAYKSILYNVVGGHNSDLVYLSPTTGEVYILNDIDYDPPSRVRLLNFTVEAVDTADRNEKDTAVVTINVRDVNDNSPKFDSAVYRCNVKEDTPPGSRFGCRVNVTDIDSGINSKFRYFIQQPSNSSKNPMGTYMFYQGGTPKPEPCPATFDQHTGDITLTHQLDYEMNQHFICNVYTEETSTKARLRSTLSQVYLDVVDVNDNTPIFTEQIYVFTAVLPFHTGYFIGKVTAHDIDSGEFGKVSYTIQRPYNILFKMDSLTGTITLIDRKQFPFREEETIHFKVLASDGGRPSKTGQAEVRFEIQKRKVFSKKVYFFTVREDATKNTEVGQMVTNSSDVIYSIPQQFNGFPFSISINGTIRVNRSSALDYEGPIKTYSFVVIEDQKTVNIYKNVTINVTDVNDNSPIFKSQIKAGQQISINRLTTRNSVIFTVLATDKDSGENGRVSYTIPSRSEGTVFSIDADTGDIQLLKSAVTINKSLLHLTVQAADNGVPQRNQTIQLTFIIPNLKMSEMIVEYVYREVKENADERVSSATLLGIFQIMYKGEVLFDIDKGNYDNVFSLTPNSELEINNLDYETDQYRELTINVTGKGSNLLVGFINVAIKVVDVNDNPPVFLQLPVTSFDLPVTAQIDTPIIQFLASDKDSSKNGVVSYALVNGKHWLFNLDSSTGILTLKRALLPEDRGRTFDVSVVASDTVHSAESQQVLIKTFDKTKEHPGFGKLAYFGSVAENSPVKSRIHLTEKQMPFLPTAPDLKVDVLESKDTFSVQPLSGDLVTKTNVDRELKSQYVLALRSATNNSYPITTTVFALVSVTDVNDNPVHFPFSVNRTTVSVRDPRNVPVATIKAVDKDSDAVLHYSIATGNHNGFFHLSQTGNVVTVNVQDPSSLLPNTTYNLMVTFSISSAETNTCCTLRVDDGQPKLHSDTTRLLVKTVE